MFTNQSKERVPIPKRKFHTIAEVRDYDIAAPRNTLLYPMQRIQELIKPYISQGKRIVNLGCETGILALMIGGECGAMLTGIDEDPLLLKGAEENLRIAKLCNYPGDADFLCAPFDSLPIESKSVDVLFADNFLYRCDKIEDVLKESRRIVKEDGVILFNQLLRDADKEKIRFIKQYLKTDSFGGEKEFIDTLNSCYSFAEYEKVLKDNPGLDFEIRKEQLAVIISYNFDDVDFEE